MDEIEKAPELLVLRKMAARLGVPSGWLRERAVAGEIPALLAGNRWIFRADIVIPVVAAMASRRHNEMMAKMEAAHFDRLEEKLKEVRKQQSDIGKR